MAQEKKQIAVYKTGEYGAVLFQENLHKALLRNNVEDYVEIIEAKPSDIHNPQFFDSPLVGLALPGRNQGQIYRDEWGEKGFRNLQAAVQNGLNIQATCAPTAILSREVHYYNALDTAPPKHVENAYAIFDGQALGSFVQPTDAPGYRGKNGRTDMYHSNVLAARVMPVKFNGELLNTPQTIDAYGIYWGGCIFKTENGVWRDDNIKILASYQSVVDVTIKPPESDRHINKIKDTTFINPPAIIEFSHGKGKAIFSSLHYEISSTSFGNLFHTTPLAEMNPDLFLSDKEKLKNADPLNDALFDRFIANCLPECQNKGLIDKKSLVVVQPEG